MSKQLLQEYLHATLLAVPHSSHENVCLGLKLCFCMCPSLVHAYFDRLAYVAAQIKAENPGIAFGEVGKALGQKWKEADAEAKAPFEEQAAKDKERYREEMAAYKAKLAEAGNTSD